MQVHLIELRDTVIDHDPERGRVIRRRVWKNDELMPPYHDVALDVPVTNNIKEFQIIEWRTTNRILPTYFAIEKKKFGLFHDLADLTEYEFRQRIEDEVDMRRSSWMHEKDVEFSLRQTGIEKVEREKIRRLSWWDRLVGNF